MGIYRGPGGTGDAVDDASSQAAITVIARDEAVAAKNAAQLAQAAAELAETNAETAEAGAEAAQTAAQTAQSSAATSATNAASSASSASTSASNASTSATNAATSETNAAAYELSANNWATKTSGPVAGGEYSSKYNAQLAATSAASAASSATSADTSASTATTQATSATNSATSAATSATNAANSATAAAASAASINPSSIAITGGSINGTTVGATTPSTGAFTTLSASGQLNLTNASNYNLYASGAGNNYMAGKLGIGAIPSSTVNLTVSKDITGGTTAYNVYCGPTIKSDVTTLASNYLSISLTEAAAFTLTTFRHYDCASPSIGSGSAITTQIGYYARNLTGATNNYAFQGVVTAATGAYNLYMSGTANNYLAGGLGIGSTAATADVPLTVNLVGTATNINGIRVAQTTPATATSTHKLFQTIASTAASAFTLSNLTHYEAFQSTIGGTSTVTSQYGFVAQSNLTGATNNYAFSGSIAAGTGRYNIYMAGTADNYLAGSLGIGVTGLTGNNLLINKSVTGATVAYGIQNINTVQSDVTTLGIGVRNTLYTAAASFTLPEYYHFNANQFTIGAGSTVTAQSGFIVQSNLTGATNNYAFVGNIASGTNRYNLYMAGTAANYFAGSLGIGTTSLTGINLYVGKAITGATSSFGIAHSASVQSDVTSNAYGMNMSVSTAAAAFTLTNLYLNRATFGGLGAGSAVTNMYGYYAESTITGATNNYGFYGSIASGSNRYNLYMAGTAANYFAGDMQFNKTVTAAGTTGAQTISKNAGTVNFAAAATSLVVTNTLVTTNSIIICTVGTNDTTMKSVSAVAAAGSFTIYSNAAATAETRVNFIVIN